MTETLHSRKPNSRQVEQTPTTYDSVPAQVLQQKEGRGFSMIFTFEAVWIMCQEGNALGHLKRSQVRAMFQKDKLGAWVLGLGHSPSLTSSPLVYVFLIGTQYFRNYAGVLQSGGVPQILSSACDYLPQEPSHDFSRPSFWKTFHYLAKKRYNIKIWKGAQIPSLHPTALK